MPHLRPKREDEYEEEPVDPRATIIADILTENHPERLVFREPMDMSVGPGTFPVIAKLTVENGAMDVSNYKEAVIFLHSNGNVCVASRVGFQPEEIIRELQEHEIKALDIKDCEGGR